MVRPSKIFVVDLNPANGFAAKLERILQSCLGSDQIRQVVARDDLDSFCAGLPEFVSHHGSGLIFLVLPTLPQPRLHEILRGIRDRSATTPLLIISEADEPGELFSLLKVGATDFITPPLRAVDILPRVWRLLEHSQPEEVLTQSLKEKIGLKQLVGESPVFLAEIRKIPIVAKCDAGVLISGETGTGKEMCARAVHYLSPRAHRPFVPINCGAIPVDLVENELFGHVKGAFTGASNSQPGLIAEANGGTLFLDEIDCLPLLAQVKLLRFLQDKQYRPVGSSKLRQADVRVVAATNVDVENAVKEGKLRQDLYYRLNVVPIILPPLRERREDIPLLSRHFLEKLACEFGSNPKHLSLEAMQNFIEYDWPGNVRELEHRLERAVVLSESRTLQTSEVSWPPSTAEDSFRAAKSRVVAEFERNYIQRLLIVYHGNISKSAQAAKKNRRAFFQLVRKHKINAHQFR